jgi:signal transduction histidine kinase
LLAQRDPAVSDVAMRIASFAKRMSRMVEQVLDATHAQLGGTLALARCTTSLTSVVTGVVDELSAEFPGTRIAVLGRADLKGAWDPDRLRQVVMALVTNAVRHGRSGGPVNIVLSRDQHVTTIAVHNELRGRPIDADVLTSVFDPYTRGSEPDLGAGLGLGLYLARQIVCAHGGNLVAESSANGTIFRVVLAAA